MHETRPPVTVAGSLTGTAVKTVVNIKAYTFIFSRYSILCNPAWEKGKEFGSFSLAKKILPRMALFIPFYTFSF